MQSVHQPGPSSKQHQSAAVRAHTRTVWQCCSQCRLGGQAQLLQRDTQHLGWLLGRQPRPHAGREQPVAHTCSRHTGRQVGRVPHALCVLCCAALCCHLVGALCAGGFVRQQSKAWHSMAVRQAPAVCCCAPPHSLRHNTYVPGRTRPARPRLCCAAAWLTHVSDSRLRPREES